MIRELADEKILSSQEQGTFLRQWDPSAPHNYTTHDPVAASDGSQWFPMLASLQKNHSGASM